jgi:hypothetical protein
MKCKFGFNSAPGVHLALAPPLFAQNAESNRVENAGHVMGQVLSAPERIPAAVLDQAVCVVIVPSLLKFAVGTSGNYGPGVMACRGGSGCYGPWGIVSRCRAISLWYSTLLFSLCSRRRIWLQDGTDLPSLKSPKLGIFLVVL